MCLAYGGKNIYIFNHARNLFDMDPERSGRVVVADPRGSRTCLVGKIYLQVSLGSLILDPIHDSHNSVR